MIRRLRLQNYMAHSDTVLELAEGLNVLVGPNNCGKSAVVSALQTLCGNARGDFMIRHGAKECAVIIETTDQHTIAWKRKGKVVWYELDGVRIDRLQGGVPEELHRWLRLPRVPAGDNPTDFFELHLGSQKAPIFLLDESPGRRAQFFASTSDAAYLMEMQRRHRRKQEKARHEAKTVQEQIDHEEKILTALEPIDSLLDRQEHLERLDAVWQEQQLRQYQLELLLPKLGQMKERCHYEQQQNHCLTKLQTPPAVSATAPLAQLLTNLTRAQQRWQQDQARTKPFAALAPPPARQPSAALQELCEQLQQTVTQQQQLQQMQQTLAQLAGPPTLADPKPLQTWLHQWRQWQSQQKLMAAQAQVLQELPPPPTPELPIALTHLRARLLQAQRQLQQAHAQRDRLEQEWLELQREIQTFTSQNPHCPTCGSPLQVDRLLFGGQTAMEKP